MQPLLALMDEAIASFADEKTAARIYARAAELRQTLGIAAGSVARAKALVEATGEVLELSPADAYRMMGERVMGPLSEQLEPTLRVHSTAHTCCLNLNGLVHDELQPLVPTLTLPVIDVEMLDTDTLRISLIASDEMLGLMCGLLMGLASHFEQVARFSNATKAHKSGSSEAEGRRYVDVRFLPGARLEDVVAKPAVEERRLSAVAVALQSLFR